MRKHYRIISSVICLLLCIGMITFGVYAAKHNLVNLDSTVSFTPTNAKLKIIGGIRDQEGYSSTNILSSTGYYGCNKDKNNLVNCVENGDKATFSPWEYGTLNFAEYTETSTKTHPDPICFYIQITNYVERNVKLKITFTAIPDNTNLECYYYMETDSTKLITQNGWWNPDEITSKENLHMNIEKEDSAMTQVKIENSIADFSSGIDTTLKTVMLVVKLKVDSNEVNINDKLNFTVEAQ